MLSGIPYLAKEAKIAAKKELRDIKKQKKTPDLTRWDNSNDIAHCSVIRDFTVFSYSLTRWLPCWDGISKVGRSIDTSAIVQYSHWACKKIREHWDSDWQQPWYIQIFELSQLAPWKIKILQLLSLRHSRNFFFDIQLHVHMAYKKIISTPLKSYSRTNLNIRVLYCQFK